MSDFNTLKAGVIGAEESYVLLCDHEDAEKDEGVLAIGRSDGDEVHVEVITDLDEFASLISLDGPWLEKAEAAAITPDGIVQYIAESEVVVEEIPGTGWERDGSLGLGRMTSIRQVGEFLYALGYGGQVYCRSLRQDWTSIGLDASEYSARVQACFYSVRRWNPDGSLIFAGTEISDVLNGSAIDDANEAEDADLLAELILAGTRPDMMALWEYTGSWRRVGLEYLGAINEILPSGRGTWQIFTNTGVIWESRDFMSLEEIALSSIRSGFKDIKPWTDGTLLLDGPQLLILRGEDLSLFEPVLPQDALECLNIDARHGKIGAIFPKNIQQYQDGRWTRLAISFV